MTVKSPPVSLALHVYFIMKLPENPQAHSLPFPTAYHQVKISFNLNAHYFKISSAGDVHKLRKQYTKYKIKNKHVEKKHKNAKVSVKGKKSSILNYITMYYLLLQKLRRNSIIPITKYRIVNTRTPYNIRKLPLLYPLYLRCTRH